MTTAHTSTLLYAARRRSHQPLAAETVVSRTIRTSVAVAKIGASLAIVSAALGFAAFNLGAHPVPAGHAIVTPAPHHQTVLGHGSLPVRQLPAAVNG